MPVPAGKEVGTVKQKQVSHHEVGSERSLRHSHNPTNRNRIVRHALNRVKTNKSSGDIDGVLANRIAAAT